MQECVPKERGGNRRRRPRNDLLSAAFFACCCGIGTIFNGLFENAVNAEVGAKNLTMCVYRTWNPTSRTRVIYGLPAPTLGCQIKSALAIPDHLWYPMHTRLMLRRSAFTKSLVLPMRARTMTPKLAPNTCVRTALGTLHPEPALFTTSRRQLWGVR